MFDTIFRLLIGFSCIYQLFSASNMIQVQIIVRHGARTPLERTYPTDPYKNYDYVPYQLEQLTVEGKKQSYDIGATLNRRYKQLLPDSFRENIVNLTADNVTRVQETALCLAASLWLPLRNETINYRLNWQPLVYKMLYLQPEYTEDDVNPNVFKSKEFLDAIAPYKESIDYIKKHAGIVSTNDIDYVYSSLVAQESYGLTLPKWTEPIYPDILQNISGIYLAASALNPKSRNLVCGTVRDMVCTIKRIVENKKLTSAPLNIFTGHDDNIAVGLRCLNTDFNMYQVDYVGNLALELYDQPYYGIKVVWQKGVQSQPITLQIKNCNAMDDICPYEDFIKHIDPASRC